METAQCWNRCTPEHPKAQQKEGTRSTTYHICVLQLSGAYCPPSLSCISYIISHTYMISICVNIYTNTYVCIYTHHIAHRGLFLEITGPLLAHPHDKSPSFWGLYSGLLMLPNSHRPYTIPYTIYHIPYILYRILIHINIHTYTVLGSLILANSHKSPGQSSLYRDVVDL